MSLINKEKFIGRLKWHIKELAKTFSNQPSFYSSKRIERGVLFTNAILLLDFFYIKQYNDLSTTEALSIFGAQLVYAGFHVKQIQKETNSNKPVIEQENK